MSAAVVVAGFSAAIGTAEAQSPFYYGNPQPSRQTTAARRPTAANAPAGYYQNAGAPRAQVMPTQDGRGYMVRPQYDYSAIEPLGTFTPAPDATPMTVSTNRGPTLGAGGQPAPAGVHKMSPETLAKAKAGASAAEPVVVVEKALPISSEGPALGEPGVVKTSAKSEVGFGVQRTQYEAPARSARKVIRSQPTGDGPLAEEMPMLMPAPGDASSGVPDDAAPDPSSVDAPRKARPYNCPSPDDFKKVTEIDDQIAATGDLFPEDCGLGEHIYAPRAWTSLTYEWKASALCHKPLYFEEVALERYGHSRFPILQPVISGAFFLGSIPVLPYKMGLERPGECIYALGYYRPGSCAPYLRYRVPVTASAVAFEAAAVGGLIAFLP